MFKFCGVICSCCMYLTLSLKMDQFLISGDLSSSLNTLFNITLLYGLSSLHGFICCCFSINNISLFYRYIYIVHLFFSQTHGLFVWYVIDFSTCLPFDGKNEVVTFLPFTSLNTLFFPQSHWDNSFVSTFVKMLGLHHHSLVLCQLEYWGILIQSDHILCIYSISHDHD